MWQNLHIQSLFGTRKNWEGYLRANGSHPIILKALQEKRPADLIPLHQEVYTQVEKIVLRTIRAKEESVD
jgi:hypothetical protein